MSTNYYTEDGTICLHCGGSGNERIHIGKATSGHKFLFGPYCKSYREWKEYLLSNKKVFDEYGAEISVDHLLALIEQKQQTEPIEDRNTEYLDEEGYRIANGCFF